MLSVSGVAQSAAEAERDLQAAMNKEVVQGDLISAIGLYRSILTRYGAQRQITAQALFHLAECQEKLMQAAEARKSYQRVVNEFADQKEAALAQSRLALLGETAGHSSGGVRVRLAPLEPCGSEYEQDVYRRACGHDGGIYLRNPSTGEETLLVQSPTGQAYALDGRWVAYRTFGEEAYIVATDGSSQRQIKAPANRVPRQLKFTDDASALLVLYRPGEEIWSYPVQGGEGQKLYQSSQVHKDLDYPVFSPDGRWAAYGAVAADSAAKAVLFIPMTGGESWEVPIEPDETPVGFTADGKIVIHSLQRFGSPSLWTLGVEQGHPGGKPEILQHVPAKGAGVYQKGEYYYYVNGRTRNMRSVSLDAVPPLPVREMGQGISPDYSADGRFLAWSSPEDNGRLIVRNLETGADKQFATPLQGLTRVRWYPDGSGLLAIGSTQTQTFAGVKVDVGNGSISPVKLPRIAMVIPSLNPTFSRDGRYIYYKRFYLLDKERGLVQRYDLGNNAEEDAYVVPQGVMLRHFSISPDGRQIAMICSDKGGRSASNWIDVAPLAGGATKRIYQTGPGEEMRDFYGLAWAADSRSVFFQTHADSNEGETLWRVSLDGSPAQRLLKKTGTTASLAYGERPAASITVRPDGREIILGLTEGGWERWVMEGLK
jgi:Tol biopolymer transport system component